HRQPGLRREVAVVPFDQLVDLAEVPALRELAPLTLERLRVSRVREQRSARLRELPLVHLDLQLDRAQPSHPGRWAAEGRNRRARVGPEVPQPLANRRTCSRIAAHVLLERLALPPVRRRPRPCDSLLENCLALTPFHTASVPACPRSRVRSETKSSTPSGRRGGNSRSPRSGSTPTPYCACKRRPSRSSM